MAFDETGTGPTALQEPLPARGPCADRLNELETAITDCTICASRPRQAPLPHPPRPIFRLSPTARILIASQAPGIRAHQSGVPFHDASGRRLRDWLAVDEAAFYDRSRIAIVPMGFCFPGHDAHKGDLPPRPECRTAWHDRLFAALPNVELLLAIGRHAIAYHGTRLGCLPPGPASLDSLVLGWRGARPAGGPTLVPLPHPSWRNTAWLNRNPVFEADILPRLRVEVHRLL